MEARLLRCVTTHRAVPAQPPPHTPTTSPTSSPLVACVSWRAHAELQEELAYYKMYDWPEGIGPSHPSTYEDEGEDEENPFGLPFELAPRVTDADLKSMGVPLGPRKKILAAKGLRR